MSDQLENLLQRVEHLLLRHEELQRTELLLKQQIRDLELDRDLLQTRLDTARMRIDSLISRIPVQSQNVKPELTEFPQILGK